MRAGLPCLKHGDEEEKGITKSSCADCTYPTSAEVEAELKEHDDDTDRLIKTLEVITPIKKAHKGEDWKGIVECPICKKNLHVVHSSYNGHVRVSCETKECVQFME